MSNQSQLLNENAFTMIIDELYTKLNDIEPFTKYTLHEGPLFTVIETSDGRIGLAANPDVPVDDAEAELYRNRVIMQAQINARENQIRPEFTNDDIFSAGQFLPGEHIVMAGFIHPVYFAMKEAGIPVSVFDYNKQSEELLPLSEMENHLRRADVLITTGTAFSNGSITEMDALLPKKARIFVIGPSVPLSEQLFKMLPRLQGLFGSVVVSRELIEKVMTGAGTRQLHNELQKVALIR